ncbi:MAG: protease pro-enzyme activation domain-containing protein [Terracidiphilus sp.]
MIPTYTPVSGKASSLRVRLSLLIGVAGLPLCFAPFAHSQEAETRSTAPSRLVSPIDEHSLITLKGNVRGDIAAVQDLGPVEDDMQLHLFLLLQRSPEQQAGLDNLLARQQQPTASEYHKWLTPKEFGARFGASPEDIAKLSRWLESHGLQVRSVLNNASMIDFAATAGQVREAFHTELHYFDIRGGKHAANVRDPQIPAALAPLVAGIKGLSRIPPLTNHTRVRQSAWDADAHRWHPVETSSGNLAAGNLASPADNAGGGYYLVTPQDLYTIYDINPTFSGGELAAKATVAVIEESDIEYGTVGAGGVATGGDVATFRTLFGVPGTLNMHVYHGYGSVACNAPGIDPDGIGEDEEASLDAEWINATAPSANEIFMSCDQSPDNGIFSSMAALIDNNLSDVMSLSYGETELAYTSSSDYTAQDTLYAQAALQGQSIFISAGDSGSDTADQNTGGTATSGINVSAFAAPTVTVAGGTDFSDLYDALEGGPAQTTYWGSSNNAFYADALSYVPETSWNNSCASSILAAFYGYAGAGLCASEGTSNDGSVIGGGGGFSTHYTVPAWQTGISGYSGLYHSLPDIAGFAANGFWGHYLIFCDSNPADASSTGCTSANNFGGAGGTSFVAPYMAGVAGLLVDSTGSRQGLLNPALYALAKAQFTAPATATACYSNGQTSNTGVTTGLPASTCIFNDVTTSNNDVPCASGSTSCYVDSGQSYGMLSTTGSSSLSVAFPSTAGFDQVTGIGTVNVQNLLTSWNTAFTSTTGLKASPASITTSQSTQLTATVTGGTPTGYVDTPPALAGTASFSAGATSLGNCTLSAGTCMLSVSASALQPGANSVTATFTGSGTYPASTSSIVTVTVSAGGSSPATMILPSNGNTLGTSGVIFTWTMGTGVTSYDLWLGTSGPGSASLYNSGITTATSVTVPSLPARGVTVYARLYSIINGMSQYIDYTYTESVPATGTPATMISPTSPNTLGTSNVMFSWTAGTGVTSYALWLGTSGPGSSGLYASSLSAATSVIVPSLPAKGVTVYARLYSMINGVSQHIDYTYTETAPPTTAPATMLSPTNGHTLGTSNVMFSWTAGSGVTNYDLWLGTSGPGSASLYNSGLTMNTSVTVPSLPAKGVTVYARLYSIINGASQYNDYTYTETPPPTGTPATMISPGNGSILGTSNVMFTWTAGTGATQYNLWLGTSGPGSSSLFASGWSASMSATVPSLPAKGTTVYARLYSDVNGVTQYNDYTYTEQ